VYSSALRTIGDVVAAFEAADVRTLQCLRCTLLQANSSSSTLLTYTRYNSSSIVCVAARFSYTVLHSHSVQVLVQRLAVRQHTVWQRCLQASTLYYGILASIQHCYRTVNQANVIAHRHVVHARSVIIGCQSARAYHLEPVHNALDTGVAVDVRVQLLLALSADLQ
jgi:hypothetical protein